MKKSKDSTTLSHVNVIESYNFDYMSDDEMTDLIKWIQLIKNIKLSNVLVFSEVLMMECTINLYYPICEYGKLQNLLMSNSFVDGIDNEYFIGALCSHIISALIYLHENMRIIHRGVSPSSIFIDSKFAVKLGELDNCIVMPTNQFKCVDFPTKYPDLIPWYSPEILEQEYFGYSFNSDVYSLGLVISNMFTGRIPYYDCDFPLTLLKKLYLKDMPNLTLVSNRPKASSYLEDFYNKCITHNPQDRMNSEKLLYHPFIRNFSNCPKSVWKKILNA